MPQAKLPSTTHATDLPVAAPTRRHPWRFLSLRWKAILPLLVVVLVVAMVGAYLVSDSVARGVRDDEISRLLNTSRATADRLVELGAAQQREVLRIAYTQDVAARIQSGNSRGLHELLEPLALAANLDVVIVSDMTGREVLGLQRIVTTTGAVDYAVSSGTNLGKLAPVLAVISGQGTGVHAAITRTNQGHALTTAGLVQVDDQPVGVVLVGTRLDHVLDALRGGDPADLTLYGPDGEFLRSTFDVDDDLLAALRLSPDVFDQVLSTPEQVPVNSLTLLDQPHNAAYIPLAIDGAALGVIGVYTADNTLYATDLSRQLIGLVFAGLTALVIVVTFAVIGSFTGRLERVTVTAQALASGDARARTGMHAHDEIGELGAALDQLADRYQHKADSLQKALRSQRRETSRLYAVLESIPDGLIVQDLDGRVLMINSAARILLGGQRAFRAARLHDLTAVVTETLGPALAPGIYALGDPTRISLEHRMLQAQAAAILARNKTRIGTVIVLRDITVVVEREQAREKLLDQLADQATVPMHVQSYDSLSALAKEVARNTRSLQRVITELRDLSTFEPRDLKAGQRQLPVNDLIWHIAAEWQPLARSARIRLQVRFGPRGVYVLGDDRRLRWAVGNLIDNSLKYSPPHRVITLQARVPDDDPASAEITVEDTGYGMSPEDLKNAFTRFYRGTPRDLNGKVVRKPGTGQGLFIARRVIEAHGGRISLASRAGAGTTAVVQLPLTAPVTLEMPDEAAGHVEDEIELSSGGPFDTVPLDDRTRPWHRRKRK
ncbi:MAG: HAMP domain-containing protein [Anaerolineae bacterium]|nr:HAMP domain-containing protein [Anaerolineae bacterium]